MSNARVHTRSESADRSDPADHSAGDGNKVNDDAKKEAPYEVSSEARKTTQDSYK